MMETVKSNKSKIVISAKVDEDLWKRIKITAVETDKRAAELVNLGLQMVLENLNKTKAA